MVDKLLNMALMGGEPILYLMLALSVLSILVVLERAWTYRGQRVDLAQFTARLSLRLNNGDLEGARKVARATRGAEARVVEEGLNNEESAPEVVVELMDAVGVRELQRLDRRLSILGTIGSNAPFVGLLGTVLGIIKAFNDLAFSSAGGANVVMAGIAEALVATAIGLLVAIPAVVFYNAFKTKQKNVARNIHQVQKLLLAFLKDHQSLAPSKPLQEEEDALEVSEAKEEKAEPQISRLVSAA